jgi:hypothetical protein
MNIVTVTGNVFEYVSIHNGGGVSVPGVNIMVFFTMKGTAADATDAPQP